jgi:hypothetical protein
MECVSGAEAATVEEVRPDGKAMIAPDARTAPWTGWTALLHPPIALRLHVHAILIYTR